MVLAYRHVFMTILKPFGCGVMQFGDGYHVTRQPRESHTRHEIAKIPLSHFPTASWIHDFPVTENYIIVPETPVEYNMAVSTLSWL